MKMSSLNAYQRVLNIDGVINFRDLGGYQTQDGRCVKWQQLYRSAQLNTVSDDGITYMASLGIKVVVDLRFSDETLQYPTKLEAVPDAEILSWHDDLNQPDNNAVHSNDIQRSWKDSLATQDPAKVREAMRVNYPKKLYSHRSIYRKMLLRLAQDKCPLVFHCAAGKDRTGVAAALILSLLGVDQQQIVNDYLLTQKEIEHLLQDWMSGGATHDDPKDFQKMLLSYPKHVVQPVFDADQSYIETLFEYVQDNYGGFKQYALQVLQLTNDDIEQLKLNLLTD